MSYNIGLNFIETDGSATPSIQPAQTSVAAFLILSERGVTEKVRQVVNWGQYTEYFGTYKDGANGAYAVKGFFDNGGAMAYITRLFAAGSDQPKAACAEVAGMTVTAGYKGEEDPGSWGNKLSVEITADKNHPGLFILTVYLDNTSVETREKLPNEQAKAAAVINNPSTGSKYIMVKKTTGPDLAVAPRTGLGDGADGDPPSDSSEGAAEEAITGETSGSDLSAAYRVYLGGGADDDLKFDSVAGAVSDAITLFDTYDVQLVCCPESSEQAVVRTLLDYCEGRGDCMFVGHVPEGFDVDLAKSYSNNNGLVGSKVYGALYYGWIRVYNPLDKDGNEPKYIPPTGHILGVYARTERERGIWKAPAGNAARINGALEVKPVISDAAHTDLVKYGSINAVRYISGQGIIIDSSRTLSTDPLWLYVNVRLLFNFVKSSLKAGLRWVVQEPNDETLWKKIKFNSVTPFLMGLWRQGAFGPGKPEQVFTVKVDSENNTPANIQQGILTVEVYFYPSRPAETIIVTVGQQEGGATASD